MGEAAEALEEVDELDLGQTGAYDADDEDDIGTVPWETDADDEDSDEEKNEPKQKVESTPPELLEERARRLAAERELEDLRARDIEKRKAQHKEELERLKAQETDLEARRSKALDDDNMEEFTKVDRELREVGLKRYSLEWEATRAEEERRVKPAPDKRQSQFDAFVETLAPAAKQWVGANRAWFDPDAPEYDSVKARKAQTLATKLEERYDRNDPQLYKLLDSQLKRPKQPRNQVAGVHRGSPPNESGQRRGDAPASREEAKIMRRYGLDASNAKDLRGFRNRNANLT